jgi:gluconokinase
VKPAGRVVYVMGVAGSGKTTIGALLAGRIGGAFVDADDLHPAANVAKMARGEALDDADRAPWLDAVAIAAAARAATTTVVVACSALKAAYRARLAAIDAPVLFVHLTAPPAVLQARLAARVGHFMKPAMLASQIAALEAPLDGADVVTVDVSTRSPDEIVSSLVARLS